MNPVALKEAAATGFPRDKMYRRLVVRGRAGRDGRGDARQGLSTARAPRRRRRFHGRTRTSSSTSTTRARATGAEGGSRQVLYNRGVVQRDAGRRGDPQRAGALGKGKPMTGEQVRWGLENLNLDAGEARSSSGFERLDAARSSRPAPTTMGAGLGAHPALGRQASGSSSTDWYQADTRADQADDQEPSARSTRSEKKHHAARLQAELSALASVAAARRARSSARKDARAMRNMAIGDRCQHCRHPADPRRQRHRGHLQPRHPGAEGRVAAGARGRHRRAARRQRRRQDDHAARRSRNLLHARARRGHQGLDRASRRAHRRADARRSGARAACSR